ncbi:MAG TPA: AAA family ATPase [Streptosporangiaceae bacterium]|nr:AAA family ATPase [Streptosporangiaceae bacterium]
MADRVLIYGVTGSGKTTMARHLAERTGLPWHSVDDLTWEPGWVGVPADEQRRRIAEICAGERWILDTAYSSWLEVVLDRVQLIVALDYPRWRSLGRLVRRTLLRNLDHRPICNGNTETFRQTISHDSIIAWHFRSFARKRARMRAWAAEESGPEVVRLTSPAVARSWLASLGRDERLVSQEVPREDA